MLSLYAALEVLITYDTNTFAVLTKRWFGEFIIFFEGEKTTVCLCKRVIDW